MAKLYYTYGTMGSSKTAQALMMRFNYIEHGKKVLFLKSSLDTRDGPNIIRSRIGLEAQVCEYSPDDDIIDKYYHDLFKVDCVIVDEIELASTKQVEQLKYISEEINIPVYTFGLRTDFQTKLFEGSKRMFELADEISQAETLCNCGKPAIVNARYSSNKIVYEGKQIEIGGNDKYVGLCFHCWKFGKLIINRPTKKKRGVEIA